jgi:hypothetical protein
VQLLRAIKEDDHLRNGPFLAVIEKALATSSSPSIRRPTRAFSAANGSDTPMVRQADFGGGQTVEAHSRLRQ